MGGVIITQLIRNKYIDKILKNHGSSSVNLLTGVRYCGKSTVLKQAHERLQKMGVDDENNIFINFREIGYDQDKNKEYLRNLLNSINYQDRKSKYIFLDNIEYVNKWGLIVNSNSKYNHLLNIYISLNVSNYHVNEELRDITYKHFIEIFPFSFHEVMEYYKLNKKEKLEKLTRKELFNEYIRYGGLPEVVESDDLQYKLQIIRWSYDHTLLPNISKLYFEYFAKEFIKYLIEETGHKFQINIFQNLVNNDSDCYFGISTISYICYLITCLFYIERI